MLVSLKSKSRGLFVAGAALLALASLSARAAETQSVRDGDYATLATGELRSVALTSDGYLMPTYARSAAEDTGNEIVWDAVREKSGSILAATGHHGRLVRLRDNKTTQTLGSFHESELTALLKLRDGSVLIAGAPTGRIYRLGTDDKITTFAQTKASFVWRMAQDDSGAIWLATGSKGQLLRITQTRGGAASVETMLDFQSTNLLDLWIDAQGQFGAKGMVYIAGQNPGWLYRFDPSTKKAEVVYNSQAEEVRSILPVGKVLALALNTERAPTPQALQLTLRMAGGAVSPAAGGRGRGAGPGGAPGGGDTANADALRLLADALSGGRGGTNVGPARSGVVLLNANGYTRTLWASTERPISSLALAPTGNILASAGENGRLFEVRENGTYALVADLREDYLVRIVSDDQGYLLTSARNGTVTRMERRRAPEATFISRPINAGTPSHWGKYYFSGAIGRGQSVDVAFRTGNDGDPDSKLWSEWSRDTRAPNHEPVAMPGNIARFVQYRLTLHQGSGDAEPVRMDSSELFYAGVNAAPIILAFDVSEANSPAGRGAAAAAAAAAAGGRGGAPGGATGAPSLPGGGGGGGGGGNRGESGRSAHSNAMNFNVTWRVLDPNTDALNYALYYRAVDEKEWKLIDDKLTETRLPLDVSGIADGRYRLRIVVTDQPGNPPGQGLSSEKISDEFTVDNSPPRFNKASARAEGKHGVLTFAVDDELSLISGVKIDFDNDDSTPAIPKDGLLDDRHEDFEVATPDMKPGEHVATIEATDRAGNSTVTKLIFVIP